MPPVEVNVPDDSLCMASDFTLHANVNDIGSLTEPINYTWFKNNEKNYFGDGWKKIAVGKNLTMGKLTKNDEGYYKVIATSAGVDGVYTMCSSASDIVPVWIKKCGTDTSVFDTICRGNDYLFDGNVLNDSGVYKMTSIGVDGRDSIVTLNLTVHENYHTYLSETICEGESFNFGNQILREKGVYTENHISESGCDSIVTLNLTVKINNNILQKDTLTSMDDHIPIIPAEYITPDGDGLHDTWEVVNLDKYSSYVVSIYNRFGKLLAKYINEYPSWNATYMGHPVPSSDYWYVISVEGSDKEYVGHFTVLRR